MQNMEHSYTRKMKQDKPFYCLCNQSSRRYTNNIGLRNHIKSKHPNEKQKYNSHIKLLQSLHNQQKSRYSQNLQQFQLKDIDVNINDIKKFKIVNKTLLKIKQVFHNEGLFDINQEEQFQNYQDDIHGEFNQRDFNIIHQVQELIQFYELQQLFKQSFMFPQLQFCQDQNENGKVISMKKELSQFYCMKWASRINLQLDLFALQIWVSLNHDQIVKIENCQLQMWGQCSQMVAILREYYEQILNNHLGK